MGHERSVEMWLSWQDKESDRMMQDILAKRNERLRQRKEARLMGGALDRYGIWRALPPPAMVPWSRFAMLSRGSHRLPDGVEFECIPEYQDWLELDEVTRRLCHWKTFSDFYRDVGPKHYKNLTLDTQKRVWKGPDAGRKSFLQKQSLRL